MPLNFEDPEWDKDKPVLTTAAEWAKSLCEFHNRYPDYIQDQADCGYCQSVIHALDVHARQQVREVTEPALGILQSATWCSEMPDLRKGIRKAIAALKVCIESRDG